MNDTKFTKLNKPDFDRLYEMKSAMRNFLDEEADFKNTKWMEKLDEDSGIPGRRRQLQAAFKQ